MKISEAKQCIKELYKSTDSVLSLVSERGVGKTSAFRQCAEEMDIGYMGLYAAAMEGPDFMGLPDKDREKGITRYLAPQFLPTDIAVEDGLFADKGLLVIEEINRVPTDTISVLYPLLLERTINGHNLAPGWKLGVTMNPDTLNYSVNILDDAMLDRFITVNIDPDLEDYIHYSRQNDPNDDVLDYLSAMPDSLLIVKKAADSTATAKSPTPRGWTRVQQLMNNCDLPEPLMQELISGIIGPETASSFVGYLKSKDMIIPSAGTLLLNYNDVKSQVVDLAESNRLDMINIMIKKVVSLTDGCDKQCRNINLMLIDLSEELQLYFFKALAEEKPDLFMEIAEKTDIFGKTSDRILQLLS